MRRFALPRIQFFAILFFLFVVAYPAIAQTTITRIEESSEWNTCGSCGNTGATGATASYSMDRGITSPSVDGSSTKFNIGGTFAFKNAYWYIKRYNAPGTPLSYLKYSFYLYIPTGYASAPQAIEFECQQKVGGYLYNFAWQADFANHQWRTFNFGAHRWDNSGVGFGGLSTGKWHHIVAEFHTSNKQVVHDALTIDGTRHAVNIWHPARAWAAGRYLSNAFQLDLNASATDYHVYVDAMSMTYK